MGEGGWGEVEEVGWETGTPLYLAYCVRYLQNSAPSLFILTLSTPPNQNPSVTTFIMDLSPQEETPDGLVTDLRGEGPLKM